MTRSLHRAVLLLGGCLFMLPVAACFVVVAPRVVPVSSSSSLRSSSWAPSPSLSSSRRPRLRRTCASPVALFGHDGDDGEGIVGGEKKKEDGEDVDDWMATLTVDGDADDEEDGEETSKNKGKESGDSAEDVMAKGDEERDASSSDVEETTASSVSASSVSDTDVVASSSTAADDDEISEEEGAIKDGDEKEEAEKEGAVDSSSSSSDNDDDNGLPPILIQNRTENEIVGIGGQNGLVYDVNALKRNLVQEAMRQGKRELLTLLDDDAYYDSRNEDEYDEMLLRSSGSGGGSKRPLTRDDLIEERLASLVQANPVSTTTDSNLLDGTWDLVFVSHKKSEILDASRFILSKPKRFNVDDDYEYGASVGAVGSGGAAEYDDDDDDDDDDNDDDEGPSSSSSASNKPPRRAGRTSSPLFRARSRHICLESLDDDETPYVVDTTSTLGGVLWKTQRRYDVVGLSRTCLELQLVGTKTTTLGGVTIQEKDAGVSMGGAGGSSADDGATMEVQILYLDGDLCISTTSVGGGSDADSPLRVFAKSDVVEKEGGTNAAGQKRRRLVAAAASLPRRWKRRIVSSWRRRRRRRQSALPLRDADGKNEDLTAVNIGEMYTNQDGTTREDPAWDGDEDPFVHMSSDERQRYMKGLSIGDLKEAGRRQKKQSEKKRRREYRQQKQFKRPANEQ